MDWFIDKLVMHQEHPEGGLPRVGQHGIVRHDIATGELVSDSLNSLKHEGSFSSSLQIRCNGSSVTVSGNPSRFHRSENLWGFNTIEKCVEVYNKVLQEYGLPAFERTQVHGLSQSPRDKKVSLITTGATIRHIDWTRNHTVGQGKEFSFLRGAASLTIGRGLEPHLYPNGATVDWGSSKLKMRGRGSTYRYDKIYIKAHDLISNRASRLKNACEDEIKYYDRLIEYCQDLGIVREEQSKKSPLLKKYRLAYYGLCEERDYLPYLQDIETALKRLEVNHMNYETIADQLIEKGACNSRQSANASECYALKWLHGTPIDKTKSQYHVHRSRLLSLGIDISIKYDVSRLPPQIRSSDIIDLRCAPIPDWYRMPNVHQLRVA